MNGWKARIDVVNSLNGTSVWKGSSDEYETKILKIENNETYALYIVHNNIEEYKN